YLAETAFREGKLEEAERLWGEQAQTAREASAAEEEWRALFGLGQVAEARGADSAQWFARSIARIESLRQATGRGMARSEFLAVKRDVYDARIRQLLRQGKVSDELLDTMERSRARALADREFQVTVGAVQQRLRDGETLVLFWIGETEKAGVWLTRTAAGFADVKAGWWQGVPVGRRVIVVPDGGIEMQPVERGVDAEIVFLPAVRMLGVGEPGGGGEGVLIAGPGLVHARDEIREIEALFPAAWSKAATVRTALQRMGQASVIHIAAHAMPDYEREERSRILLEDGPLLLRDVGKTKLRSSLVTLSACQTGAGRRVRGEGIQSLAQAFLAAGAQSVVASRQAVDDSAARAFMAQFYAALARGETKAGALRTAKRRLRESGGGLAKPEHWEPWILFGDGRSAVAPARSWMWVPWIAALAAAAGALVAKRVRPVR
ncbi:MAG: CHAT domain-containing protein, partial [Bryobacterales bacterium]|nr:CHAT domain-containing protein [Bryobacterales bacterium]